MALRVDTSVVSAFETPAIDDAIQQPAILVAQAGTDSAPAERQPDSVVEIADGQILRLPEGTSIDEPRMNGANLEFVQPDGSVVVIPNGAVTGLTIFIGSVEIPPIAVAALFEANGIEAAAGPEASAHRSSGGDFSRPVGDIGDALNYGGLLDDSAYNTLGGAQGQQDYASNLPPMFALPGFIEGQLSEQDLVGNGAPGSAVITLSLNASDPNNDPLAFSFGTPASGLTSNGVALSWTGIGTDSLTGWAGPNQVITATISGGSVTITLLAPLDHPNMGNDSITFDLPITASDGQGGSASTFVRVTIGDDSPTFVGADDGLVDERAILAPAESPQGDLKTASGSLGISWGADSGNSQVNAGQTGAFGDRAVVFSATIEADLLALGLSSGGTALSYALDSTGTNLIASAGTRMIFTVALSDEGFGGYVFTLVGNLDHADAADRNDVSISFGFTALDADGDSVPGTFKVVIVDDVPVANDVLAGMAENQTLTVTLVEGVDYSAGADGSAISLGQAEIVAGSTTINGLGLPGITLVGNVVTVTPGTAFDALAKDETVTLRIPYTVTDGDQDTVTREIIVTVTGTNDAPVLFASAGKVTEIAGKTLSLVAQTVSGSMVFTDADLNDVGHSATITGVTRGGESDGLPSGVLGTFYLRNLLSIDAVTKAAGSADGTVNWTFSAPDLLFDYLSAGQTATLTYAVRLSDGDGGFSTQNVTVTIVGTNDQPRFVAGDLRVLSEVTDQTGGDTARSASGVLLFTDVDRDDAGHVATVEDVSASGTTAGLNSSALLNALTITHVSTGTNQVGGSVSWSFSASDRTFDYLGRGESVTLAYQVKLDDRVQVADGKNLTDTTTIYITIVGTNDRPVIGAGKDAAALTETAQLSSTGTLAFTDVDLTDTHSVSEHLAGAEWNRGDIDDLPQGTLDQLRAAFDAQISNAATGDGVGAIQWDFALAGQAVDFLAKGEKLILTYRIALRDDSGAANNIAYKDVTITVTGTNDRPVVESNLTAGFAENSDTTLSLAPNGVSGIINFTDVDLNDTHTATIIGARAEGVTGALPSNAILQHWALTPWLSIGDASRTAVGAETGTVDWAFAAPDLMFDYLGEGETLTLIYTIRVRDNNGGQHQNELRITVTGTNDRPVFANSSAVNFDEVAGQTAVDTPMSTNGVLVFADADINDTYEASVVSAHVNTTSANAPADIQNAVTFALGTPQTTNGAPGGYLSWSFDAKDSAFDFLAQGETLTLTYTVAIKDGSGAANDTATTTVTVTITGTNDAPVIMVESGDSDYRMLLETNEGLTASGTLTVTDLDVSDVVEARLLSVRAEGSGIEHLFTLDDFKSFFSLNTNPVIASGETTGQISWSFDSGNEAFNFLPKGWESILEYTIEVSDGKGGTASHVVKIKIQGTNDAPVITVPTGESTILLGGETAVSRFISETNDPLTASGVLTVKDADNGSIVTTQVVGVSGGGGAYNIANAANFLTLTPGSINDAGETANNLSWTFNSGSETFDFLPQGHQIRLTYTIRVTDQHGLSDDQLVTILINGTHDAPVITIPTGESTILLDGETAVSRFISETNDPLTASGVLTVKDADNGSIVTTQVVGVSGGGGAYNIANAANFLALTPGSINDAGETANNLSWTFNSGSETFDFLPQGHQIRLTYTIRVTDQHGLSDDQLVTILINGTNDAPELSVVGADGIYIENGAAVAIASTIAITDVDDSHIEGATVQITGNFVVGQDVLNFIDQNGITGNYDPLTGILTLAGSATKADYEAALKSVTYLNSSENPSTAERTITFAVDDGNVSSNVGTATVFVTAVNDAPISTADEIEVDEGGTVTMLVGGASSVLANDADAENDPLTAVLVSGPANGSLTLNADGTFSYAHDGSETTTDSFTYRANDGTENGNIVTVSIRINPVNDIPTLAQPNAVTYVDTPEDDTFVNQSGQLVGSDPDLGDTLTYGIEGGTSGSYTVDGAEFHISKVGTYGTLYVNSETGGYVHVPNDAAIEALNAGTAELFTVTVTDGNSVPVSQSLAVNITAVPEAPAGPPTVIETASTARYALANDALADANGQPKSILFDATALFSGSGLTYTVEEVYSSGGKSWSWMHSANSTSFSGNPGDGQAGLYVAKVTATNSQGSAVTYVAFHVLGGQTSGSTYASVTSGAAVPQAYLDNLIVVDPTANVVAEVSGGAAGYDVLVGNGFANNLNGGSSDDMLLGGDGDDTLYGGSGRDYLSGGAGNDTLHAGTDGDWLDGGEGNDTLHGSAVADILIGGAGDDIISGNGGLDWMDGGSGNDILRGGTVKDVMFGGDGDDELYGDLGDDVLDGGAGNDLLVGGNGSDILTGGAGADRFVANDPNQGVDTITDYVFGEGDTIDLSGLLNDAFVDNANVGKYVRLVDGGSGSTAVQVDTSGQGNEWGYVTVMKLANNATSISVIIDDDPQYTINLI